MVPQSVTRQYERVGSPVPTKAIERKTQNLILTDLYNFAQYPKISYPVDAVTTMFTNDDPTGYYVEPLQRMESCLQQHNILVRNKVYKVNFVTISTQKIALQLVKNQIQIPSKENLFM